LIIKKSVFEELGVLEITRGFLRSLILGQYFLWIASAIKAEPITLTIQTKRGEVPSNIKYTAKRVTQMNENSGHFLQVKPLHGNVA